MLGYKHINPVFADALLRGEQIKIGTLDHYAKQNGDREDILDGAAGFVLQNFNPSKASAAELEFVRRSGNNISGDITIPNFMGSIMRNNQYVYCVSREIDNSRRNKERIIEISDLRAFGCAISRAVGRLFGRTRVREVQYSNRRAKTAEEFLNMYPDPFIKDLRLSFENELRIAWDNPAPHGPIFKIVNAPEVRRLVREV